MQYPEGSTAVSVAGAKDAALYFDYIVPVGLPSLGSVMTEPDGRITASISFNAIPHDTVIRRLLPPPFRNFPHPLELINGIHAYAAATHKLASGGWAATLTDPKMAKWVAEQAAQDVADPIMPPLMKANIAWIEHLSNLDNSGQLTFFAGRSVRETDESVSLTLSGISLIDTKGLDWRHLDEFRHDETNVRKLRRLRLFVYENYNGKPTSYIQDDIAKRLEDYEESAKTWGFPLRSALLHTILNDRAAIGGAATLGAALFGEPILATVAGIVGGVVLAGRATLDVLKQKHGVAELRRTSALAYLIELKGLSK